MGFFAKYDREQSQRLDVMQRSFLCARIVTEKDLLQSPGLIHSRQDHESVS